MEEIKQPEEMVEELPKSGFLEKLRIHKFKILAAFLGFLVSVGAVFGAYKLGQRQAQPGPQPTPTPALVATPTPLPTEVLMEEGDLTVDWKTYTNLKLSYSIRYPPDWSIRILSDTLWGEEIELPQLRSPDLRQEGDMGAWVSGGFVYIYVLENEKGYKTADEYVKDNTEESVVFNKKLLNFKGLSAVYYDNTWGGPSTNVCFLKNSEIYLFSIVYQKAEEEKYKRIFNLMLSTFRFLEERDEAQIKKVLDEYIPEHSLVKVFELEGLKILGNFAKVTVVPKDVVTDKAMVILEKSGGEWSVIWGPGTAIGKTDPVLEKIPEGLLE